MKSYIKEDWIRMPTEEEIRDQLPPGTPGNYDLDFIPAMSRLLAAHAKIGPLFKALFKQIMFEPGHLNRREREMIPAVARPLKTAITELNLTRSFCVWKTAPRSWLGQSKKNAGEN